MEYAAFAASVDHTVLGPETTRADVERVVEEAERHGMNACVPPCYVADARAAGGDDLTLVSVVGFPHGQHRPGAKQAEAVDLWEAGADELDVVINVGRLRAGEDEAVERDLAGMVASVPVPVKVIVETALLSEEEKHRAAEAAVAADADMLKTSTGFADGGATVPDVELLSTHLPVKASGGVGSYAEATAMLEAGATRVGASSGVAIVEGHPDA